MSAWGEFLTIFSNSGPTKAATKIDPKRSTLPGGSFRVGDRFRDRLLGARQRWHEKGSGFLANTIPIEVCE